jgi:hypothetical protein
LGELVRLQVQFVFKQKRYWNIDQPSGGGTEAQGEQSRGRDRGKSYAAPNTVGGGSDGGSRCCSCWTVSDHRAQGSPVATTLAAVATGMRRSTVRAKPDMGLAIRSPHANGTGNPPAATHCLLMKVARTNPQVPFGSSFSKLRTSSAVRFANHGHAPTRSLRVRQDESSAYCRARTRPPWHRSHCARAFGWACGPHCTVFLRKSRQLA